MELEEHKNKWKQLDEHIKAQDDRIRELTDAVIANKVKSPLNTLKRHCFLGAVIVPLMLPFFFWLYSYVGLTAEEWLNILRIMTIVFVAFTWLREMVLLFQLKNINIGKISAVASLRETVRFRKMYHYGVAIGIVLGLILVLLMFCCMNGAFVSGGIVGGIIGGVIGGRLFRYYTRKIDELEASLREWEEDEDL